MTPSTPRPLDQVCIRASHLVATDMDGETVMMNVSQGTYFGLGGIGGRIWTLLTEPATVEHMVRTICSEYAVDEATCRVDVEQFLQELLTHGLVTVH